MASFYGPNSTTLGGLPFPGQSSDPVTSAILARFPQLRGQTGGPTALSQLGYTAPGLDYGQGQGGLGALTLFEGAKPVFSESITGGLALGTLGKSGSQTPAGGGAAANVGNQLQLGALPAFPAASLSDIGMALGEPQTVTTGGEGAGTGGSLDVGSIVSAGQGAYDALAGTGGGQVFDPQGQTQSQAFQQQRIGERDYSNLTGSPSGIPQLPLPSYFSTGERAAIPQGTLGPTPTGTGDFLLGGGGPLTQQFGTQGNILTADQAGIQALLEAGYTPDQMQQLFSGAEQTLTGGPMFAPGGSAQQALSPSALQSFLKGGVFEGGLSGLLQQGPGGFGGNLSDLGVLGTGQYGLQGITGLLGVVQGIQSGDIPLTAGSALSVGQAVATLANFPGLASALGIAATPLAIFNAAQDPSVQNILGAALTTYGTLSSIAPGTFTPLSTLAGQGLSNIAPGLASALGIGGTAGSGVIGGIATGVGSGTAVGVEGGVMAGGQLAPALSAASVWALPAAYVIQAVMDTIAEGERQRVQNAGFLNNPIKGALYSGSTAGVKNAQDLLNTLTESGVPLSEIPTDVLMDALPSIADSLLPYFATAQGGRGAIRASDTITGHGADWAAKPYMGGQTPEEYTQRFTQARSGLTNIINDLMARGVPFEQISRLPMSGDWAGVSLDAGGTPDVFYAGGQGKYDAERAKILSDAYKYGNYVPEYIETGSGEGAGWLTPTGNQLWQPFLSRGAQTDAAGNVTFPSQYGYGSQFAPDLLGAALGSSMIAPADVSNASGLMSDMYGGPMAAALARMGAPEFTGLIQNQFDPWIHLRDFNAEQLVGALSRDNPALRDLGQGGYMQGYTSPTPTFQAPAPISPSDAFEDWARQQAIAQDPVLQAYQQQLAQYQQQADAWWRQALNQRPLTLPTVEAPGVLPGIPGQNAQAFAPQTITGGGLTPEQLEWLRSQGWLA